MTRGAGVFVDPNRRVLEVEGDRAADMLQGLVTADVTGAGEGIAVPSLVLSPKGRVLADALILRPPGKLLFDLPVAGADALDAHLARYLPPRFAKLVPSGLSVARVRGPLADGLVAEFDPRAARLDEPRYVSDVGERRPVSEIRGGYAVRTVVPGAVFGEERGEAGGPGYDLYLETDALEALVGLVAEGRVLSSDEWEIWRIERGLGRFGQDVDAENLPQESGWVRSSTSFRKGCYTGQEVLARIHYRGKVNRRLVGLRFGESGASAGDVLSGDGREVGRVTSAARSPRFGWIGLGYARREIEDGDVVRVEDRPGEARIRELRGLAPDPG